MATVPLSQFLTPELLSLYDDGDKLIANNKDFDYDDYSFLVFPFAKVYEGFLKLFFLRVGAISEQEYYSDHWRVGKALNPQLEKRFRSKESVYDRIVKLCNGEDLARELWLNWKNGRNLVFHYFPHNLRKLSRPEALSTIDNIKKVMDNALTKIES
ncbi:MAG: hypothetical protein M1484_02065 [Patescibacteria group bacterium]|nr:hypothetical protein [Patescibacteria group bacterium]MCL5431866.1 hypothetical protein [Patescibacteria group bacterium]